MQAGGDLVAENTSRGLEAVLGGALHDATAEDVDRIFVDGYAARFQETDDL